MAILQSVTSPGPLNKKRNAISPSPGHPQRTLRTLAPQRAAALLLTSVYSFTLKETAGILTPSVAQVKNWLQEARRTLDAKYAETCALVSRNGVCYQCSELSTFFHGVPENPLAGNKGTFTDRVRVVQSTDNQDLSTWHRLLLGLIEDRNTTKTKF